MLNDDTSRRSSTGMIADNSWVSETLAHFDRCGRR
jgi:hypothetical protein